MPDARIILDKHSAMNCDLDQNTKTVSYSIPRKNEVFSVQRQHSMNVITSLKNNNEAVKRQKQAKKA